LLKDVAETRARAQVIEVADRRLRRGNVGESRATKRSIFGPLRHL